MGVIHFNRFDLGIDLRRGASVSDANRLLEMQNAYVTTGLATQKRPGLTLVQTLEPGTRGLFAAGGKLHTFYGGSGALTHGNPLFVANRIPYSADATRALQEVAFADVFNGFVYVAAHYAGGVTEHHYLDGSAATHVADANCPRSGALIKLASKLFAVNGDTVRFCATGQPRNWSAANDAGFLPTGLNARGDRAALALGVYQGELVVLARDGAQIWHVDPDPAAMALKDVVENVGTRHARTVASVGGDLYFLSDFGFRSITTLKLTDSLADVDVGSPIDALVRQRLRSLGPQAAPLAFYYDGTGQYVCALGAELLVYSLSRTARVAAWSRYVLPHAVDAFAELGQTLYIRCGDAVYALDDQVYADQGQAFEVVIQLPYLDLRTPGQLKRLHALDVVLEGTCELSVGFDVRDPTAFTPPVRLSGNTRGGGLIPVECCGTEFSVRLRNLDLRAFRLDALSLYFDVLGAL